MSRYRNTKALKLIGERIKKQRLKEKLLIEDVVEMTGFTHKKISDIEEGKETSLSYFIGVCLAINIHPKEILSFNPGQPRFKLSSVRKEKSRLTSRITDYLTEGYFQKGRTARDVITKLKKDFDIDVHSSSASAILRRLVKTDLLKVTKEGKKNRYYN